MYSAVASLVYHNDYDQNREFRPDGTFNLEGKQRRTACKSVILGIMYGRGIGSIADQIKTHKGDVTKEDIKEAKDVIASFYENYPKVKEWMDATQEHAKKYEFVEDLWGRRRRLPDINRKPYEFIKKEGKVITNFNPLLNSDIYDTTVPEEIQNKYIEKFKACKSKEDREAVERAADKEGIIARDNSGFIAQAERQAVNARIQGGAATMTKLAMRNLYNSQELKDLGFHLLIPVHDELICECPIANVERCKELLSEIMCEAGKPNCNIPMKCDADAFPSWYYDVIAAHVCDEFEEFVKKEGKTKEEALEEVSEVNSEFTKEQIIEMLGDLYS